MQRSSGPKITVPEICKNTVAYSYSGIRSMEYTLYVVSVKETLRDKYLYLNEMQIKSGFCVTL